MLNNYGNTASPEGLANNLMTCDVDSTVTANGLQNCGSACGLGLESAGINDPAPAGMTSG